MRHVLLSYHTCPMEEPGTGLAGGMNVFLRGLLAGLHRHGIETDVLTRGRRDAVEITRPFPGVRVVHVPCGWEEPPTREAAFRALPRFAAGAVEALGARVFPPDAVSAHYWMSGMAARTLMQGAGSRALVFSYHTVEVLKPRAEEKRPDPLSAARKKAEDDLAAGAFRVVFLSERDRSETGNAIPGVAGKEVVIPPGVDDSFRRPPPREEGRKRLGIPSTPFLFLLAARTDPGKNAPAAVQAVREIRGTSRRDAILLVAGQDPPAGEPPAGVVFAGPVPHAGMPAVLSAVDAAVCPSAYESFGLVPLEAMAAGVPVIVPSVGYWGDTVRAEGGGAVYDPGTREGLADAMRFLMEDDAARSRMAEEGRKVASRFTWEKCTESWAELLSSAARRGSRR